MIFRRKRESDPNAAALSPAPPPGPAIDDPNARALADLGQEAPVDFETGQPAQVWEQPAQGPLAPGVEDEVRRLIAARQMIHAIKLIREQTGLGLRDAKELAESIAQRR